MPAIRRLRGGGGQPVSLDWSDTNGVALTPTPFRGAPPACLGTSGLVVPPPTFTLVVRERPAPLGDDPAVPLDGSSLVTAEMQTGAYAKYRLPGFHRPRGRTSTGSGEHGHRRHSPIRSRHFIHGCLGSCLPT